MTEVSKAPSRRFFFSRRTWIVLIGVHALLLSLYLWARSSDTPIHLNRSGSHWTVQISNAPPKEFETADLSFDRVSLWVNEDTAYTESWNEGGWSSLVISTADRMLFDNQFSRFAGGDWRVNWRGELLTARRVATREGLRDAETPVHVDGDFSLVAGARRTRLCSLSLHQDNPPATLTLAVRTLQKDYECSLTRDGDTQVLASDRFEPSLLFVAKELLWKLLSIYFSAFIVAGITLTGGLVLWYLLGGARRAKDKEQERRPRLRVAAVYVAASLGSAVGATLVLLLIYRHLRALGTDSLIAYVTRDFGAAWLWAFVAIIFGALVALGLRLGSTLLGKLFRPPLRPVPPDWLTVALICLTVFLVAAAGAKYLMFETPHVQDSVAYLIQGKMLAAGRLWAPAPKHPEFFEFPFLRVEPDTERWFCVYTPGHPAMLALGVWAGHPWLVAPVMAALTALFVYLTAKMIYGRTAGLVAAALAMVSPWFLFMSTSFMSHPTALFFVALFLYLALKAERGGHWTTALGAGAAIGMEMMARPMSAAAAGLPVLVYYVVQLARGKKLWARLAWMAAGFVLLGFVMLAYNYALTGNPLLTPRGKHGMGAQLFTASSFSFAYWVAIAEVNLSMLLAQLYGWPMFTLAFVVAALLWERRKETWLLSAICVTMLLGYSPIRYHFHLFGPRFWYEALFSLLVLSGAGLAALGRLGAHTVQQLRIGSHERTGAAPWLAVGGSVMAVLVLYNVLDFAPLFLPRLESYNGITGKEAVLIRKRHPRNAIIFAECKNVLDWQDIGRVLWMNDPILERGDIIAAKDLGPAANALLASMYPDRRTYFLPKSDRPELEEISYKLEIVGPEQLAEHRITMSFPNIPQQPKGVALNAGGELFVLDYDRSSVVHFNAEGNLAAHWGKDGKGNGEFHAASGIAVGPDSTVYVLDGWNKRVVEFSPAGEFLGNVAVELYGAQGIAVSKSGRIYIADTGNGLLRILAPSGEQLPPAGGSGSDPGLLKEPIGVAVGPAGDVFVCDTGNRRVEIFDENGQFLRGWPVDLWEKGPRNGYVAVDPDGVVWVSDPGGHQVARYTAQGELLGKIDGPREKDKFNGPTGIAIDPERNRVYVANMFGRSVSVLAWKSESKAEPAGRSGGGEGGSQ